ncbi:carbohydrate-binding family 6 protein [Bacteroidota bacterium]
MKNTSIPKSLILFLVSATILLWSCNTGGPTSVSIYYDQECGQEQFAVDALINSLERASIKVETGSIRNIPEDVENASIIITSEGSFEDEGFSIKNEGSDSEKTIRITGGDKAGAMYGGLELAEQIRIYGWKEVLDTERNPYMKMRGIKFNIPLDVRTPSYTDPCDAAQQNIAEMWSFDFWKDCIDDLAKNRYNYVSLWNLHPFPSMVKVPEYPDVALSDVHRSTVEWKENYSGIGVGFDAPEIINNFEVLKKMTIEEKIKFWQKVMAYGKSRNIDFYVVTWNIFDYGTGGQYGITDKIDNEITKDYFRKSVKQMFLTYPDLAGIGLTTGENMPGSSAEEKEAWAFDTYALGVMDVAKEQPERQFKLLHRQHMTGAKEIAERFSPMTELDNVDFLFSFKYAKAHAMSSINQPFCNDFIKDIEGMKTIWTLRNDDNYHFRWGAPDFVRDFIQNIPYEVSEGFYYGSDQWIWGREFLSLDPETPRQVEVAKHWYHWMLWGRLGYDPDLTNERFIAILDDHFPEVNGEDLFNAWQEASMIYPVTTGFHWGSLDFQWYIEACKSRPRPAETKTGFHDVNRFITLPPHPGVDYQSIPDYVEMIKNGGESELVTPLEISQRLHAHSDKSLEILKELNAGDNKELGKTLNDITAMAYLGKYYAHKVAGATELELARKLDSGKNEARQRSVDELTKAAEYWKLYIDIAAKAYKNPLWTNRVGYVIWDQIYEWVLEDIEIARGE